MKPHIGFLLLCWAGFAHAYSAAELHADCRAAADYFDKQEMPDPYLALRGGRCIAYVAGFADGYSVSDYLADSVGVKLNAFCLPAGDEHLSADMVHAVLKHLDELPPGTRSSTATLVAGALASAFPCSNSLEPKK